MLKTKKKILFITNTLNCGGAENALISLLQVFDFDNYQVDLQLMKNEGEFIAKLPKEVSLLKEPFETKFFDMSFKQAVLKSLIAIRFDIIFARLIYFFYVRPEPIPTVKDQKLWRALRVCLPKLKKEYDVSISYLENIPNFYNVDKVNALKKIAFIRTDYEKMRMNPALDRPYFKKLTALLTVSKSCEAILQKKFSELPIMIGTMQSVFSLDTIELMSDEPISEDLGQFSIVSVGRLIDIKGFDLAIEACSILVKKGYEVRWFVVGDGILKGELQKLVDSYDLGDNFYLVGHKENPYPYIKRAGIYAQTSRFEGKSRAIEEAKILKKVILTTRFPTVSDQLIHLDTGYVVDIDAVSIADGIIKLIDNKKLGEKFVQNLGTSQINNEQELKILYDIIEN
jgi:glycosyltransferase involved in cell wall biosynthesis